MLSNHMKMSCKIINLLLLQFLYVILSAFKKAGVNSVKNIVIRNVNYPSCLLNTIQQLKLENSNQTLAG